MDGAQIVTIVLGSGLLSGLITTLLTQFYQRKEKRYDPRRETYAELLAAMDAFEKQAEQAHSKVKDEPAILVDEFMAMLDDWSHPLNRPLAQVQLLAPGRTVTAAEQAMDLYNKYFLASVGRLEVHKAHDRLVALMRKDLGSVA